MAEAFMRCYHVTGKAKKVNKVNNEKKKHLEFAVCTKC